MATAKRTLAVLVALALLVPATASEARPTSSNAPSLSLLQQLFVFKEMNPDIKRVGILWKDGSPKKEKYMRSIEQAQAATEIKIVVSFVSDLEDVGPSFRQLLSEHDIGALWIIENDGVVDRKVARSFLIENAAKNGIPILAPSKDWVSKGPCVTFQKGPDGIQIIANKATTSAMALSIPEKYKARAQLL